MRRKTANAILLTPGIDLVDWLKIRSPDLDVKRFKVARKIAEVDRSKWLLSHCVIISGVKTDEAEKSKGKFKDYLISPDTEECVNSNDDAWENRILEKTYKTFIGVPVALEHIFVQSLFKGKIIDAAIRDQVLKTKSNGEKVISKFVDVLVAVSKKFTDLVRDIKSGRTKYLSMGSQIAWSICSKCGKVIEDDSDVCEHIRNEKGTYFVDSDGVRRKVAELCGHYLEPESNVFIEVSWVDSPAFAIAESKRILVASKNQLSPEAIKNLVTRTKYGAFSEMTRKKVASMEEDRALDGILRNLFLGEFKI